MLEKTIRSLKLRGVSWSSARVMMRQAGLEPGQGWVKTLQKFEDYPDQGETNRLRELLVQHILCGDKLTKLYPMTAKDRLALHVWLDELPEPTGAFADRYPDVMDENELAAAPDGFHLVAVESDEDGIGAVFTSVFKMRVREEIPFEDFDEPDLMKERFDEIVGYAFKPVQLFHVVWVPHERPQLEIRVDSPPGIQVDAVHAHSYRTKEIVNRSGSISLDKAINLFPAVRAIYDDPKEGTVSEVTFSTTTSAVKHEKMIRRTQLTLDQRKEAYHLGGKEALATDIRLYRIKVEWPKTEDSLTYVPNLVLAASGPSGANGSPDPTISGAFIGNCVRSADYEFVVERLGVKAGLTAQEASDVAAG